MMRFGRHPSPVELDTMKNVAQQVMAAGPASLVMKHNHGM